MDIPAQPTWLGSFKGAELSYLDTEVICSRLDPGLQRVLWTQQDTIWFDYVRMHPVKALYYFCKSYGDCYGRYLESNINMELKYSKGIKGDPLQSREVRQLIALKVEADKRGIPYPIWIARMLDHFASNGWTRPPRPSHLVASDEAKQHAQDYWLMSIDSRNIFAADPWFEVSNWQGHAQQQRHEDWVVSNIKLREHKHYSLAHALYGAQCLRIERAIQEFGDKEVQRAQQWQISFANQISNP